MVQIVIHQSHDELPELWLSTFYARYCHTAFRVASRHTQPRHYLNSSAFVQSPHVRTVAYLSDLLARRDIFEKLKEAWMAARIATTVGHEHHGQF